MTALLLDLLQISAGATNGDIAAWRAHVLEVYRLYPDEQIHAGLDELAVLGFITSTGSPRTGWLTLAGHRALSDSLYHRTVSPPHAPAAERLTFEEFDRLARRQYWHGVLFESRGNLSEAARLAGCKRSTTYSQIRTLGLRPADFKTSSRSTSVTR